MNRFFIWKSIAPAFAALILITSCGGEEVRQTRVIIENVNVNQQKTVVVENVQSKPEILNKNNVAVKSTPVTDGETVTIWVTNSYLVQSDESVLELAKRLTGSHGERRMSIIRERFSNNLYTVLQTAWILNSIDKNEERFALLKMLAPNVIDLEHRDYLIKDRNVVWEAPTLWKAIDFVTNLNPVSGYTMTNGTLITHFVTVQSIKGRKHDFSTISEDEVWDLVKWLPKVHGDKRLDIARNVISGNNLTVFQAAHILNRIPEDDKYFELFQLIASHVIDFENRDYLSDRMPSGNHTAPRVKEYIKKIKVSDSEVKNPANKPDVMNTNMIKNPASKPGVMNTNMIKNPTSKPDVMNMNMIKNPANKPSVMNTNMIKNPASKPSVMNTNMIKNPASKPSVMNTNVIKNPASKPGVMNTNVIKNPTSKPGVMNTNMIKNPASKPSVMNTNLMETGNTDKIVR